MLYYPWYDESNDLLGGYTTYAEHYEHVKVIVYQNEQKYTLEEVENVQVDEDSRPEHAWCQLAPTTEHSNSNAREQGVETLTELSEQDLVDNANLLNSRAGNTAGLSVRFESAANPQVIAPDEYINKKLWLCTIVTGVSEQWKLWKVATQLSHTEYSWVGLVVLASHIVIKLIQSDTLKLVRQSGTVEPDDVLVLLTAPTGVAAYYIQHFCLAEAGMAAFNHWAMTKWTH